MVPDFDDLALLVIDAQEKLVSAMPEAIATQVVRNIDILVELVAHLGGTIFYTEQYPRGLGSTVEPIKTRLADAARFEKISFSCLDDANFAERALPELPEDVIVVGMETHVCVLQTVLDLVAHAYEEKRERQIFVPLDAVCSRKKLHWENGLDQMVEAGATLTNTETLVFQALGEAGTDAFKHFSKRIR